MGDIALFSFTHTDLSTGFKIRNAAELVVESGYPEAVVVISTIMESMENLSSLTSGFNVSDQEYVEIISMRERTSVRIFSSALRALGLNAVYFDPTQEDWPIITTSDFRNAEPDIEETTRRVEQYLVPLFGESIPVVCGRLGCDQHGRLTLLSKDRNKDTTVLLAQCLKNNTVRPEVRQRV